MVETWVGGNAGLFPINDNTMRPAEPMSKVRLPSVLEEEAWLLGLSVGNKVTN